MSAAEEGRKRPVAAEPAESKGSKRICIRKEGDEIKGVECIICTEVLVAPVMCAGFSGCGQSVCESHLKDLKKCPHCQDEGWTVVENRGLAAALASLRAQPDFTPQVARQRIQHHFQRLMTLVNASDEEDHRAFKHGDKDEDLRFWDRFLPALRKQVGEITRGDTFAIRNMITAIIDKWPENRYDVFVAENCCMRFTDEDYTNVLYFVVPDTVTIIMFERP